MYPLSAEVWYNSDMRDFDECLRTKEPGMRERAYAGGNK